MLELKNIQKSYKIGDNSQQVLNIDSISVTFAVLKFDKLRDANPVQRLNIEFIFVTKAVLKLDKSIEVNS